MSTPLSISKLNTAIAPQMRSVGFERRKGYFVLSGAECCGLVELQRSNATGAGMQFYVNVGALSRRVWMFLRPSSSPEKEAVMSDCEWETRLESPSPRDAYARWWIRDEGEWQSVTAQLRRVLAEVGEPELRSFMSEGALRARLEDRASREIAGLRELISLSILQRDAGDTAAMHRTVEQMKRTTAGHPAAGTVRVHLEMLGI